MSHNFSIEYGVPGFDWDELTEHAWTMSRWRDLRPYLRYCKRNGLRYKITRWRHR